MNEQQQQIIEGFGQGQSVVAGAGCGKTTTLVAKCQAFMARNPDARFCAVSFTEKSVRDLRESLVLGFGKARLDPQHWVKTIHGLCSTIIQEFPVSAGLLGGERILMEDEASRLWSKSVSVLWTSAENEEINRAVARLLLVYSRLQLEAMLAQLRSLMSFGVQAFLHETKVDLLSELWLVFESVYHRYQHAKDRAGALDFNDLEIFALKCLNDEKVRAYYQSRFGLVLVDEFQDTNPIQGEILEKFVRSDFSNLCIVGDPKQSIYRFRDADVSVFQELSARLPKQHLLGTNYRSRPGILKFVNEVCAPAFAASELPYEPLSPGRVEDAEGLARVSRLELDDEKALAEFLSAQAASGIDLSEYVILARSVRKDKTVRFLKALDTAGIPYLLGSGGRFYSDPRVKELIAFLRGWVSDKNTLSQVAALRSPWIGIPDDQLLLWNESAKDRYFFHFFQESDHPVARALKAAYQSPFRATHLRPGQVLEILLRIDGFDEELYMPMVSLWHKAETLSGQGRRFEEIVQYFTDASEKEKIEKEIPAPAEAGMVRVMTVHSSKGLQFPRVMLIDFDGEYRSQGSHPNLIWDRKQGLHLFKRDEEGARLNDDPENAVWITREKQAQVAESKRVFYVALTRAQEELILIWKREIKKTKASLAPDYNPYSSDNWRAWIEAVVLPPLSEANTAATTSVLRAHPAALTERAPVRMLDFDPGKYRPRHSPSEWLILNQCELRYRLKYGMVPVEAENEQPRFTALSDREFEPATQAEALPANQVAEKGERIHEFIEKENWDELRLEFRSPELGDQLVEELQKILQVSTHTEIYREFGFESPLSRHEALVGMMDRLEVNESEQSLRIVDYKFTARPKTREALLGHYALQLQLYAWAAWKLCGFTPRKIEGRLIHMTEGSIEIAEAPSEHFQLDKLESTVALLFEQARSSSAIPSLGTHCRYCEFVAACPAQRALHESQTQG